MSLFTKACGVDVHKDTFTATLLREDGVQTMRFEKDLKGIEAFKGWLRMSECKAVVMESTGVYWIPLYAGLEGEFDVKLVHSPLRKFINVFLPGCMYGVALSEDRFQF